MFNLPLFSKADSLAKHEVLLDLQSHSQLTPSQLVTPENWTKLTLKQPSTRFGQERDAKKKKINIMEKDNKKVSNPINNKPKNEKEAIPSTKEILVDNSPPVVKGEQVQTTKNTKKSQYRKRLRRPPQQTRRTEIVLHIEIGKESRTSIHDWMLTKQKKWHL